MLKKLKYTYLLIISIHLGPLIDIITYITESGSEDYERIGLSQIIRGTLTILMLLYTLIYRKYLVVDSIVKTLIYFVFFIFITSLFHDSPYKNIVFGMRLLFLISIYLYSSNLMLRNIIGEDFVISSSFPIIITVIVSLIFGYILEVPSYEGIDIASSGITGQPAGLSTNLASILPILFISNPYSLYKVLMMFFILGGIFITFRRTAIIAGLSVYIIWLVYSVKYNIDWIKKFVIFLMMAFAFVFLYEIGIKYGFFDYVSERFDEADVSKGGTGSGRSLFWEAAYKHILNRGYWVYDLFGEGYEASRLVTMKELGTYTMAHNDFIEILVDFGLVGIIFLIFYYRSLIKLLFNSHNKAVVLSIIIITFVFQMFAGGYFDPTFAALFLSMAYIRTKGEKRV